MGCPVVITLLALLAAASLKDTLPEESSYIYDIILLYYTTRYFIHTYILILIHLYRCFELVIGPFLGYTKLAGSMTMFSESHIYDDSDDHRLAPLPN